MAPLLVRLAPDVETLDEPCPLYQQGHGQIGGGQRYHGCGRGPPAQDVGKALGHAALKPGLCQKSHVDLWEEGRSISGRRDVIRRIGEPAMMKTPACSASPNTSAYRSDAPDKADKVQMSLR